ncbi:hypothetical protein COEREDRAFT_100014 [Coemansia reversa NRRL 1564]|uniref:Uncharacterized protein n=1 Tax=Coemansia reversa (strain ATCC 12441 / NRRL 1564) TaxID=763665 RepID=A0A2G5B0R8_COERN|nr:hypothetical protein COEREDRAFT_100014 [Coemansia reversa NRRL 1564]|eukprot:PIA12611.1 hypothetical protein COEREDRAFT_100014 [Coemansia reversa NRRL 1564]
MMSENTSGKSASDRIPAQMPAKEAASFSDMATLIRTIMDAQAERDAKRDKEQTERDAKREEELRLWRVEQAERDAKRDKEQSERDAKREDELRQWRVEQNAFLEQIFEKTQPYPQAAPTAAVVDMQVTPKQPRKLSSFHGQQEQHGDKIASNVATPHSNMTQNTDLNQFGYINLSEEYKSISYTLELSGILGMLGNGWDNAWDVFTKSDKNLLLPTINTILAEYHGRCEDIMHGLAARKVSEDTYQSAFSRLAETIEKHAYTDENSTTGLYWHDTHNTSIKRSDGTSRKPDGSFFTRKSGNLSWKDIAVVVEIKDDHKQNDHDHIRGQLLQNFIDMTMTLPRRFMIGLTLASHGSIDVHFCLPGGIYTAHLGNLPLTGCNKPKSSSTMQMPAQMPRTEDELRVVTFLLFLYKQSLQDCGYLTGRDSDYPSTFLLEDVIGATTNIKGNSLKSTSISLECHNNEHRVLGRHRYLKGQRTWLYPAMYDKDRHPSFFKFQWGFEGEGEISAHEFVQNRGIPNVPKLHYGASIAGNGGKTGRQKYVGEVIVMEDVGETIMSIFDKSTLAMSEAKIINIFAGYAHTLIAAAIVDDNKKITVHLSLTGDVGACALKMNVVLPQPKN